MTSYSPPWQQESYNEYGDDYPRRSTLSDRNRIKELQIEVKNLKNRVGDIMEDHSRMLERNADLQRENRIKDNQIHLLEAAIEKQKKIIEDFEAREQGKIKFITDNPGFLEVD